VVTCPECGRRWNAALLVHRGHQPPWFQAPGLNRILSPVAWLACWAASMPVVVAAWQSSARSEPSISTAWVAAMLVGVGLCIWGILIATLRHHCRVAHCVRLALLAHIVFAGYATAIVGVVIVLSWVMAEGLETQARVVAGLLGLPAVAAVAWGSHRLERFIARRCLAAAAIA
jgi:hypothetical protein